MQKENKKGRHSYTISDKTLKQIAVIRDKEYDPIIKGSIHQEHIIKFTYVYTQLQTN